MIENIAIDTQGDHLLGAGKRGAFGCRLLGLLRQDLFEANHPGGNQEIYERDLEEYRKLLPFLLPGVTKEQAVAAYEAAHPDEA